MGERSAFGQEQADWIARHCGARPQRCLPVCGGCIHQAWRLELDDGRQLFAKTHSAAALPLLSAEADGLEALAAAASAAAGFGISAAGEGLVVPRPLALGLVGEQALLLLPWLSLGGGGPPGRWHTFGAALAALHRHSLTLALNPDDRGGSQFGWHRDNAIGSSPQHNAWNADWGSFFVSCRLAPQLRQLQRSSGSLPAAEALLARVPQWLSSHSPPACLVHGDLWSGNAALVADSAGALFDPAVHRADREVDLAMARLFGGFPDAFFGGYEAAWPLPAGHRRRADLYNLYHLLNHANLFGGGYRGRCQVLIESLLADPPGG